MEEKELKEVLRLHKLWLEKDKNGKRADLSGKHLFDMQLNNIDLSFAILNETIFNGSNLDNSNLSNCSLEFAYFENCSLKDTNLSYSNLKYARFNFANLIFSDLSYSNLKYTEFQFANLFGSNLNFSILKESNFECSNLINTILDEKENIRKGIILEKAIIGYKKCKNDVIVKLSIPKGAIVFSVNNNRCRTNRAKVLKVIGADVGISDYDNKFVYRVGDKFDIKDFNLQYNFNISNGIHFFRTKKEAIKY